MINKETGEFIFNENFAVGKNTQLGDLIDYFGKKNFLKSKFDPNCYLLSQQESEGFYLKFFFYFKDDNIEKIEFEVETEPIKRIAWSSNRDVETKWIADQMGDTSNFVWDLNKAGRHYHLEYKWGSIGVYYDFKNGTFTSVLVYL